MRSLLFFAIIFIPMTVSSQASQPRITSDFPGGNIFVEKASSDTFWLRPDLRDTEGDWFYWYFKITGVSGRTINFRFTRDHVFTSFGPAFSINQPDDWHWLGRSYVKDNCFSYTFSDSDTSGYFSMAFPYTEENFYRFIRNYQEFPAMNLDTICFTREGRAVEELWINKNNRTERKVLITARHHACEMMANYVLEGMIDGIFKDPGLAWMKENVEFRIIPFIDKDGVENGDQGKNRIPRDHNRDYDRHPIYRITKVLQENIPEWSADRLKIALDLHCPWITGENNEWIYMVGSSNPENERQQIRFSELIENSAQGELEFDHSHFLPFGEAWNTKDNYAQGISFDSWAGTIPEISLSTTIEFPYANVSETPVSRKNAREFGRAVAFAMMGFLKTE